LDAISTNWSVKLVAGKETLSTLVASQAVHLALWLPAVNYAQLLSPLFRGKVSCRLY
jgi:hypothetical protein